MDHTAIKLIQDSAAAVALSGDALVDVRAHTPVVALPDNFKVQSLEKYLDGRVRFRASFRTAHINSFAAYHEQHDMAAPMFIDPDEMAAVAIYNLGDEGVPGHGDHTATLKLEKTAPFKAFLRLASNSPHSQRAIAEWVEDWRDYVHAYDANDAEIPPARLAATLRTIDIESARKVTSTEEDFSATRSALESIEAKSGAGSLPKYLVFTCEPYLGLPAQQFAFRVGILTGDKDVKFSVRRIQEEADTEATAEAFVSAIRSWAPAKTAIYQGTYTL